MGLILGGWGPTRGSLKWPGIEMQREIPTWKHARQDSIGLELEANDIATASRPRPESIQASEAHAVLHEDAIYGFAHDRAPKLDCSAPSGRPF